MIYVVLGKDNKIVKKKIEELISKLNIDNIIKYDGSETELSEIINEINYVDLFNEKKLIIVSDFSFKKIDDDLLIKYIENMNDNVIIFRCIDETLDERKKVTKLLKDKCKIIKCGKLDYRGLHAYVTDIFAENNKKITYYQIKRILDLCQYNADITLNEVDKLLLYKIGESTITDEDIENVISKNSEKEMFTFVDCVLAKDIVGAMDSYNILISSGTDEAVLIDAVAKQFRMLYQTKCRLNDGLSAESIARELGVKDYIITKLLPYVNNYSENDIADMLYKLSDMDSDIKILGYDKSEVFEYFLISL